MSARLRRRVAVGRGDRLVVTLVKQNLLAGRAPIANGAVVPDG